MDASALLVSRIQFGFTISAHIIFPAFSIGSSAFVATLLVLWRRTGRDHYLRIARFWTKIFAVSFAMGVVSGIPLSYELGTNWSRYSLATGNVVGPLIGYEVLTAFFLESTFLGVMLFGWTRVPPWLHVTSAILVALGTMISAFWILSANSWMQTPAGHIVQNGLAIPTDWFHVIFNPSFPYRFTHMLTAAYLTTSVVVLAAGARYLLEGKFQDEARTMLRMGVGMVAILGPAQLFFGDQHGLNTLEYQPAKVAAMEGHWENNGPAALVLFGIPDDDRELEHRLLGQWTAHGSCGRPDCDQRHMERNTNRFESGAVCGRQSRQDRCVDQWYEPRDLWRPQSTGRHQRECEGLRQESERPRGTVLRDRRPEARNEHR